ncbi:MAG TPA: hypothetical protein VGP80_16840 [Gemmatimonadales bacterium]|jgi:hypothetical protein|nr:hypothetical protein [Gemmatimonadales bacterium]
MLKPLLGIAATGVVAVLAWKLMVLILLPMLGLALGIVAVVIKVFFILFVLMIAYWLYRRLMRRDAMAA